jgi:hypothetical protein
MININKTKKPLSIILILKKIIFSNKNFFRLLKNEKNFLKLNIYNIYFFLFYYYMINSLSYISFLKFNHLKRKQSIFTLNLFLKKNLKRSFKFFFKNIIMFLYKFSLIKHKNKKFFSLFNKSQNTIFKKHHVIFVNRKKQLRLFKKRRIISRNKKKIRLKKKLRRDWSFFRKYMKVHREKKRLLKIKRKQGIRKQRNLNMRKKNARFERYRRILYKKKRYELYEKIIFTKKLRQELNKKIIVIKKKTNQFKTTKDKLLIKKNKNQLQLMKIKVKKLQLSEDNLDYKFNKTFNKKFFNHFKSSLKKTKESTIYKFKKLFLKKTLVKRLAELSFKKDIQLKNAASILKNNKKFKFLTFPLNSICKFFFKNSMYNIFMTLVVLPTNLTIGNYSGGHFNILSKRRDRGSINSLKSMAKLISLKIYQSNLSFIIFCPRLFTNNNKRLIKTIFYSFKILNRSPITKIYLYRPVIRNGIRSKKIPRK